ncbi:hypothetical protein [Pseudooceanicola sp. HF7]|uniref:hypothetical protein n=1 Tax=Pseudooceanicola sp. HF7 TaxID=2721560 RepID=UPI00142F9250|nr:hypothetical protein [Pseudooceanicola sp. HF7]NIZ09443.1 hypothetical protein [Pseudooceanicola sp. HF7]
MGFHGTPFLLEAVGTIPVGRVWHDLYQPWQIPQGPADQFHAETDLRRFSFLQRDHSRNIRRRAGQNMPDFSQIIPHCGINSALRKKT